MWGGGFRPLGVFSNRQMNSTEDHKILRLVLLTFPLLILSLAQSATWIQGPMGSVPLSHGCDARLLKSARARVML